ncbi:MAG TPA: transglycosylase SLT domain-containing protein [Stellaceae bacterium]|nr:transglycosylase SLT domain-containing protein [Stellaceae bacterium]
MTASNPPIRLNPSDAVVGSIRQAAQATDVDFGLLMAQAQQESGFRADAKASGSSATGLFQFIDSTWLGLVRQFGDRYGVGALARSISVDSAARPSVADPATRQRILDLREDPRLSSALAAEYARLNKGELERTLGRPVGNTEIYLAHFLGARGAASFLTALAQHGDTPAADLLPEAAQANHGVFYDGLTGRARSVADIYRSFGKRIEGEAARFSDPATPASSAHAPLLDPSSGGHALSFDPRRLSSPLAAMLNLFAFSALHLLGGTPQAPHAVRRAL